jgi:hypothetical protein
MTLKHIFHFILDELSAGNIIQNLGFYTLFTLLIWVVLVQFKQKAGKYRVN